MQILISHVHPGIGKPMQTIELAGVPRIGEYVVVDYYVLEVVEVQWVSGEDYVAMLRVQPT